MSTTRWKQAFPEFANTSKTLVELLASGELSEDKYLTWASEEYQIPLLTSEFFDQANNFNLLIENPGVPWSSSFFPVHEWKGVLYIACLEPQKLDINKPYCLIFGSFQAMKKLWDKLEQPLEPSAIFGNLEFSEEALTKNLSTPAEEGSPSSSEESAPPAFESVVENEPTALTLEPVEPLKGAPTLAQDLRKTDAMNTDLLKASPTAVTPISPPINPSASAAPVVAERITPAAVPLKKSTTDLDQTLSKTTNQPTPSKLQVPKAPAASAPATSATASHLQTSTPPPAAPRTPPPIAPHPAPAVPVPPKTPASPNVTVSAPKGDEAIFEDTVYKTSVTMNPNFTANNYKLPEEVTNVAKIGARAAEMSFTSTKTIMPFPEKTSQFTFTRTIYSSQVILEASTKINENKDPQQALLSAFKILQDYYKKIMWVVRDQKGYAFPIACNSEWEFLETAWDEPMSFKHVNPFRTAKLTQKPYHGPVYASPATDKFLKQWNGGRRPDQLTIIPVVMFGKVFGYLVGCDKGPHYENVQSLETMQKASKELLETFLAIHRQQTKHKAA